MKKVRTEFTVFTNPETVSTQKLKNIYQSRPEFDLIAKLLEEIVEYALEELNKSSLKLLDIEANFGELGLTIASLMLPFKITLADDNARNLETISRNINSNASWLKKDSVSIARTEEVFEQDIVIYTANSFNGKAEFSNQIHRALKSLNQDGFLIVVSHKNAGSPAIKFLLLEMLENPDALVEEKGKGGYRIYTLNKSNIQNNLAAIAEEPNVINFSVLGENFEMQTMAGLFSPDSLDGGTRLLIESVPREKLESFSRLLDIGCGQGPIGLVANRINPKGKITMTDIALRAIIVASKNIETYANNANNVNTIHTANLLELEGEFDLIISNPPFHATDEALTTLFFQAKKKLVNKGSFYFVVENSYVERFIRLARTATKVKPIKVSNNFTYTVFVVN